MIRFFVTFSVTFPFEFFQTIDDRKVCDIFMKKLLAIVLSVAMLLAMTACTKDEKESSDTSATTTETTTNDTTESSESSAAPTETTAPEEEGIGPNSVAVITERVVDTHGQLQVIGTDLCDSAGTPYQLRGMSTHGLNHIGSFLNADVVKTLAEDWGCSVIRLAVYTESDSDDYIKAPDKYFTEVCRCVDLCVDQGIYVIVDWHILNDGDPMKYKTEAIDFFNRISEKYADVPNVLYEICNEPNNGHADPPEQVVTWEDNVKPYAEELVSTIRANDPDNIIIIGSSTWSQDVDIASNNPVEGTNLMYTLHFYAGSHGQELRDKATTALNNGLPIFVTEWGTTNSSGSGDIAYDATYEWMDFINEHNLSWCNWSIGSTIAETSNTLKLSSQMLTVEQKQAGHWPDKFITRSGLFVRSLILGVPFEVPES